MGKRTGTLLGRVALRFDEGAKLVPEDLSAAARGPHHSLYLAADERAAIEVLRPGASFTHAFDAHRRYDLAKPLGIAKDAEIDIEGLAIEGDHDALWLCGSHSAKRKKPKGEGHRRDLDALATVTRESSRFVLARVPLDEEGAPAPSELRCLRTEGAGSLLGTLCEDDHLAPFVPGTEKNAPPPIPGKDNGLDVEGLAFFDGRILLGLRGPVLRGWAFVLELAVHDDKGELALREGKRGFRKHALGLDGLGVRDLIVCGDDLLVLAGPTMALDGAHRLFRWKNGPRSKGHSLVRQEKGTLEALFDLPWGPGVDRAEGVTMFSWFEPDDSILVVYDSPRRSRRLDDRTVLADVFAL